MAAFAGLRLGETAALEGGDVDFLRRPVHVRRQVQRLDDAIEIGLPHDWIFAETNDVPPRQNTIGRRWRTTLRRAGVTDVRLHDLRHINAPGLIALGCDVVAVQRALGHARSTTTLTTYAHL